MQSINITPPCFTERDYKLWLMTPTKERLINVCVDCTEHYQRRMLKEGRCINAEACAKYVENKAASNG